ncbi:hypothetical protein KIPB_014679, partial [Kipferlia bialata]
AKLDVPEEIKELGLPKGVFGSLRMYEDEWTAFFSADITLTVNGEKRTNGLRFINLNEDLAEAIEYAVLCVLPDIESLRVIVHPSRHILQVALDPCEYPLIEKRSFSLLGADVPLEEGVELVSCRFVPIFQRQEAHKTGVYLLTRSKRDDKTLIKDAEAAIRHARGGKSPKVTLTHVIDPG